MDGKDMVLRLSCSARRISACRRARGAADFRTADTKTALVRRRGRRAGPAAMPFVRGLRRRRTGRDDAAACRVLLQSRPLLRPLGIGTAAAPPSDAARRLVSSFTFFMAAA